MTLQAQETNPIPTGAAPHDAEGSALAGSVLAGPLGAAGSALVGAHAVCPRLFGDSEDQLSAGVEAVAGLRADLDRVLVAVLLEATTRGCQSASGLSVQDWVGLRCPGLARAEVSDLVTVVTEGPRAGNTAVLDAVTGGEVSPRRAGRVLRTLARLRPVLDGDGYDMAVSILLPVAAETRYTEKDLTRVTDHLLGLVLPEKDHEARARASREMRGVNESSLADGTLTRFVVTTDAEGAATIRAVLDSPLAAPAPDGDGPDPRTPTQRRHDALLTVIGRGVSAPEGTPTTTKAKVIITMAWDTLKGQLAGLGRTMTGDTLSPVTVRKFACSADLIPAVLGADGELLDVGRAARLASPAQHLALWRRDKHCSFPGCSVPPQWCDAHHCDWWSREGRTDLARLALLCGRHHTLVHDKDLTATIDATGVTWHV